MNYARNIETGKLIFFEGLDFNPKEPEKWALYWPLPQGYGNAHPRIGEDPDVYKLRQLIRNARWAARATQLKIKWHRFGLLREERDEIERMFTNELRAI